MMNQEDIFKKIGLILNELQDQYEYLGQNPKDLHELELELFMANANFLTDHIQIVSKLNSNKVLKELPQGKADETESNPEVKADVPSKEEELPLFVSVKEPVFEKTERSTENKFAEHRTAENIIEEKQEIQERLAAAEPEIEEQGKIEEHSSFEFILNDPSFSDKFEFEEKSVDDIFDRPLSAEELRIIEQKQKLKEQQLKQQIEEDEVGPEPFLVAKEEDVVPAASHDLKIDVQAPVVDNSHGQYEEPVKYAEPVKQYSEPVKQQEPIKREEPIRYENPVKYTEPIKQVEPIKSSEPVKHEEPVKLTLNERLAGQLGGKSVGKENTAKSPITDLKQGINLNDKMLYIKDLFNGYNLAYAEVIDLINKMPDFKTADSFLQSNYAAKNNWAGKQATVDKFYEVLQQRFQD